MERKPEKLNKLFWWFIPDALQGSDTLKGVRKAIMVHLVAFWGLAYLIFYAVLGCLQGNTLLAITDISVALAIVLLLICYRNFPTDTFILTGVILSGVLYFFLFITGKPHNTGYLWLLIFPLFAHFLLGSKQGGIITGILLVVTLLFSCGTYSHPFFALYSTDFKIRFFMTFSTVAAFSYVYELIRENTEKRLAHRNTELKDLISMLRNHEQTLLESEERFRTIAETIPDAVITTDHNDVISYCNTSVETVFGYPGEELIGKPYTILMPVKVIGEHQKTKEQLLHISGNTISNHLMWSVAKKKNGTEFPIEFSLVPWSYNAHTAFTGIFRDITERQKTDSLLRESKEFLESIFKMSPDIIMVTDQVGMVTAVNDAIEKTIGFTPEEVIGRHGAEMAYDDAIEREKMNKIIDLLFKNGFVNNAEVIWKKKGGGNCPLEMNTILFKDSEGSVTGSLAILRDMSDRKQMEFQLQQAQKMEAVGKLAGGIAHDFNNILAVIVGNAELALDHIPEEHTAREELDRIVRSCMRARSVVRQILTFSRKHEKVRKVVMLQELIHEASELLRISIPENITFHHHIQTNAKILASPAEIHQVLINLITNAADAMSAGKGDLTIRLRETTVAEERYIHDFVIPPGSYVELSIGDTGIGIADKDREHLFEPYYTTKDVGKGTGMGLAVVHGIVHSHGGAISVESTPGKGTRFDILLPITEEALGEVPSSRPDIPTGDEHLLLVDDEKPVAQILAKMLESLGYTVDTCTSSVAALELFKRNADTFSLVLTDFTMPDINGYTLAKHILDFRRDIPIILYSGYSNKLSPEMADVAGIKALLTKPFTRPELAETVRTVLDLPN